MDIRNALTRQKTASQELIAACRCERRGNELVMACQECAGNHDLSDLGCLNGVIESLAQQGGVTGILLSGDWDVVYGPVCATVLRSLADIKSFCHQAGLVPSDSKDCNACPSNPASVFSAISSSLLGDWQTGCRRHATPIGSVDARCHRCREETGRGIEQIAQLMTEVERHIARQGHRAIEVVADE
jgi:hypothetical protein